MVQNVKEIILFACKTARLIEGIADGADLGDLPKLFEVAKSAGPAFKDAKLALAEYVMMTDAEAVDLEAYVVANCELNDDNVEQGIEKALAIVISLRELAGLLVKKEAA